MESRRAWNNNERATWNSSEQSRVRSEVVNPCEVEQQSWKPGTLEVLTCRDSNSKAGSVVSTRVNNQDGTAYCELFGMMEVEFIVSLLGFIV